MVFTVTVPPSSGKLPLIWIWLPPIVPLKSKSDVSAVNAVASCAMIMGNVWAILPSRLSDATVEVISHSPVNSVAGPAQSTPRPSQAAKANRASAIRNRNTQRITDLPNSISGAMQLHQPCQPHEAGFSGELDGLTRSSGDLRRNICAIHDGFPCQLFA